MCVWPQRRDEKTATGTSNRQPLVSMSPLESTRMWGQCYDGGDSSADSSRQDAEALLILKTFGTYEREFSPQRTAFRMAFSAKKTS